MDAPNLTANTPGLNDTNLFTNSRGYVVAVVGSKVHRWHRMIWERAYGPIPDGCHVHHKDGVKTNNRLFNLELMPAGEHRQHHHYEQVDRARRQPRDDAGRFTRPTKK